MGTLIIPCAGKDTLEGFSICIMKHPDGKYIFEKCIEGIEPFLLGGGIKRIIFAILIEDEKKYQLSKKILSSFSNLKKQGIIIEVICLENDTSGPAETVYQTIIKCNISGKIIIKDMDNKLETWFPKCDNFVVGNSVFNMPESSLNILSKSFLVVNEQGHILDIIEKELKSEFICLGMYGFHAAKEFCNAYISIKNSDYNINKIYISHIIAYIIGCKGSIFNYVEAFNYESYGSDIEWKNVCQRYKILNPKSKNKLAIVDLDGTLFDTKNVNYNAYKISLEQYGISVDYEYFCNYCSGKKYTDFLPKILGNKKYLMEDIHNRKKAVYHKYIRYAKINRHLFDILKLMKTEYYIALVTTASSVNCMELLNKFGLSKEFDLILTQSDVNAPKPDPEGFINAMSKFKIKAKDTIVFEDSDEGIEAAERSGIQWYRCGKI